MPASSSAGSLSLGEASLSTLDCSLDDDEVRALHKIVCIAQNHADVETNPCKALFEARDDVLAGHGEDPDDDPVYLRFLLRIAIPRDGLPLYERFKALMDEMRITLEFGSSDVGTGRSPAEVEEDRGYLGDQDTESVTGELPALPPSEATLDVTEDVLALAMQETTLLSTSSSQSSEPAIVPPPSGPVEPEESSLTDEDDYDDDEDDDDGPTPSQLAAIEKAADELRRRKLLGRLMRGSGDRSAAQPPAPPALPVLPSLDFTDIADRMDPAAQPQAGIGKEQEHPHNQAQDHDNDDEDIGDDECGPTPPHLAAMEKAADEFRRRAPPARPDLSADQPSSAPLAVPILSSSDRTDIASRIAPVQHPQAPKDDEQDDHHDLVHDTNPEVDDNKKIRNDESGPTPSHLAAMEKAADDFRRRKLLGRLIPVAREKAGPTGDEDIKEALSTKETSEMRRRELLRDLDSVDLEIVAPVRHEKVDEIRLGGVDPSRPTVRDWRYLRECQEALSVARAGEEPRWEEKKAAWSERATAVAAAACDRHWQTVALRALVAEYRERLLEGTTWRHYLRRHQLLRRKYAWVWRRRVEERRAARSALEDEQRAPHLLGRWMVRRRRVVAMAAQAVSTYAGGFRDQMYQQWDWADWERQAEAYDAGRLRATFLGRMMSVLQIRRELEAWVDDGHQKGLVRKHAARWKSRHQQLQGLSRDANEFDERSILARALTAVATYSRLAPIAERVSWMVDWRVARTYLHTWRYRLRCARVAGEVDEARLLKHFWHEWNDRLRERIMGFKIDERVVRDALHRWVMKRREIVFGRRRQERMLRHALTTVVNGFRSLKEGLTGRLASFHLARDRRAQASVLSRWTRQLQLHRQRETVADTFHVPGVQSDLLQRLRHRKAAIDRMQHEAEMAAYYIRAKRTLARLRQKVDERRKEKYKTAYAQLRTTLKIHLARRFLRVWRDRLAAVRAQTLLASRIDQYRVVASAVGHFGQWRLRAAHVLQLDAQGSARDDEAVLRRHLDAWLDHADHNATLAAQAARQDNIRVANTAGDLVRKLGMRGFQMQNNERAAAGFHARLDRKHGLNMFRYWRERTRQRREAPAEPSPPQPFSIHDLFDDGDDDDDEAEAEERASRIPRPVIHHTPPPQTARRLQFLPQSLPQPQQGYLQTPSRRSLRAQVLTRSMRTPGPGAG